MADGHLNFIRFYQEQKQNKYQTDYQMLRDEVEAEEVVARTFLTVWEKQRKLFADLPSDGARIAMIRTINKNKCRDILRKWKRDRQMCVRSRRSQ